MIALFDAPPILLTVLVLVLGMLGGVSGPNCDNAGEPHADAGAAASDNMEATLIAAGSCLGVEQDVQCGSGDTCCEHTCLEGFTGGSVVCVQGADASNPKPAPLVPGNQAQLVPHPASARKDPNITQPAVRRLSWHVWIMYDDVARKQRCRV